MRCNNCGKFIVRVLLNLEKQPLANNYLNENDLNLPEKKYPLKIYFCKNCKLIQTSININPKEIFKSDYAYLSSTSTIWLMHAKSYVDSIYKQIEFKDNDFVLEIASNDGYLLQYFNEKKIKTLGIEPTKTTHEIAVSRGINSINLFLDIELAKKIVMEYGFPKVIIANNVIAHVPERRKFFQALKEMCDEGTLVTLEFHDAKNLVLKKQYDTIYHEHYSYYSLESILWILNKTGFYVVKYEELTSHGGSLRIYAKIKNENFKESLSYLKVEDIEHSFSKENLKEFKKDLKIIKQQTRRFFDDVSRNKKIVAAYGAAAKGNTFLNFMKIRYPRIRFVVDNSETKQGKYLPGSKIPIVSIDYLKNSKIDYLVVLPWNIYDEIKNDCIKQGIKTNLVRFFPSLHVEQI